MFSRCKLSLRSLVTSSLVTSSLVAGSLVATCLVSSPLIAQAPMSGQGWPGLEAQVDTVIQDLMATQGLPGMTVALSKDGRMILDKGYGYADFEAGVPMQPDHRSRIGSTSKVITGLALTRLAEIDDPIAFGLLDEPLYGSDGLFPDAENFELLFYRLQGHRRHMPVVGTVIRKTNDWVYTYYADRTYSIGHTSNLGSRQLPQPYEPPAGYGPSDIRGMAASETGLVYTLLGDGSVSVGDFEDLDSVFFIDAGPKGINAIRKPAGQTLTAMVGLAVANSSGLVYSWYEDGTRSVGDFSDLASVEENVDYTVTSGHTPWDIRSMAIAGDDRVYAFYGGDGVTSGTSTNLDRHRPLYSTTVPAEVDSEPWPEWYEKITLRRLLSHTSGLIRDGRVADAAKMFDLPSTLDVGMERVHQHALRALPMSYEPGQGAAYSNHGIGVAGWVLEEVTGMSFIDFVNTILLAPIDLEMGRMWEPGTMDAAPHRTVGGVPVVCACAPSMEFGEWRGGLTSNAGDLVRLMLATDRLPNHPDLMGVDALDESEGSYYLPFTERGLGWGRIGGRLGHTGKLDGGRSAIAKYVDGHRVNGVDVEGITVAIATNIETGAKFAAVVDQLAELAAQVSVDPAYDLH